MSNESIEANPLSRRTARRALRNLERWTKIIGITATVFGIIWTAWTYAVESGARNFDRRQKAWSTINAHAKDVNCAWEPHKDHTNTGHIDSIEFLASQGTSMSGIGLPCSEFGAMRVPGAHLNNASLWYSNFAKADLSRANLSSSKLPFSQLSGADLDHADLTHAVLTGITGHWANFAGAKMMYANLVGSDLSNADFRDADLSHSNLSLAQLTHADFTGAKLDGATLTGACYRTRVENESLPGGAPRGWPEAITLVPVCPVDWQRRSHD
jgi:uncharacterized protein YjbI with pentapeptide repeats